MALLLAFIRAKILAVYAFSRSAPTPEISREFPIEVSLQVFQALFVQALFVQAISGE
jgi:hypothetical protein